MINDFKEIVEIKDKLETLKEDIISNVDIFRIKKTKRLQWVENIDDIKDQLHSVLSIMDDTFHFTIEKMTNSDK